MSPTNATNDDPSCSTAHHSTGDDGKKEEGLNLAQTENKVATWLRVALLLVLLVCIIVVSLLVLVYMRNAETAEFEKQFESASEKLVTSIVASFDSKLLATDAFVINMVSHAQDVQAEWPFVTLPNFGVQAAKFLSSSGAFIATLCHVIEQGEERIKWENYTKDNDAWLYQNLEVMEQDPNYFGPVMDFDIKHYIHDSSFLPVPYNETERLLTPNWQSYPSVSLPFNYDYMSDVGGPFLNQSMKTRSVVMSRVLNLVSDPNDEDQVFWSEFFSNWANDIIAPDEKETEPMCDIYYPLIDKIRGVDLDRRDSIDGSNAVGAMAFTFYWRTVIRNILPSNLIGVIVVFRTGCGELFTYRIDGAEPIFLGEGDHHDAKYDDFETFAPLTEMVGQSVSYTGVPLDTDVSCFPAISIYPSQSMEDEYVTSQPVHFALVTASIFVFTSVLFLLYDCVVGRRQKLIQDRALASGAIVNSLFPENVRDKLYQTRGDELKKKRGANQMMNLTGQNFSMNATSGGGTLPNDMSSKPIADLFEETTVFFGDLAGFTEWSSKRTPVEVFELLEALYGAFDAIAKRRGVFKIETIGDCYVAVTGIPFPKRDHAIIMVKFARDCMQAMRSVLVNDLAHRLGEDTLQLEMRVGLHSGPTTAGVLRGEKGRFQLFGDTVNTASRMESNGVKGQIHVSEATAEKLIEGGKKEWLTARKDTIVAKGKGEMRTYFAMPTSTPAPLGAQSEEDEEDNEDSNDVNDCVNR